MEIRSVFFGALALAASTACAGPTAAPTSTPSSPTPAVAPTSAKRAIDASLFTKKGGCGDTFLWAATEDGATAVTVEWKDAASHAWDDDGFDESAVLPDIRISVALVTGVKLSTYYCNDLLEVGQGPDREIPAVAGALSLAVVPQPASVRPSGLADLDLTNVDFEVIVGGEPQVWHLDALEWRDYLVGWLAG
jgi:hypothetical protein